jgi:hypothetical protein
MNQKLLNYVREQIKAGYNPTLIKDYLIKYGYTPSDVAEAINEIYHPGTQHHVHHLSKNSIIAIGIISILIALLIPTISFYLSSNSESSQLLDLRTSALNSNVKPGAKIEFNIELSNLGISKRYDVTLRHEIVGTDIFKEETIAVETSTSKTSYVQLLSDIKPGRYNLKTTASYSGKKAVSTFSFNIVSGTSIPPTDIPQTDCVENWNCNGWIPSVCPSSGKQTRTCNDINNCGTSLYKPETSKNCEVIIRDVNPTIPAGSSTLTIWQKLDAIKETAQTDPTKAERECDSLELQTHKDECYNNVAQIAVSAGLCDKISGARTKDNCYSSLASLTNSNQLCESISTSTRKDSCYMNFVNKKDYSVCDKIENPYLREACSALRDMPSIYVS